MSTDGPTAGELCYANYLLSPVRFDRAVTAIANGNVLCALDLTY